MRRFHGLESKSFLEGPENELEPENLVENQESFLKDPETELEPENFLNNPKIEMELLEALKWVESIDESEAEMESPDAPRADGECDKDAERKNGRAGYKKKTRKRNTARRAMKRTTQSTTAAAAVAAATATAALNINLAHARDASEPYLPAKSPSPGMAQPQASVEETKGVSHETHNLANEDDDKSRMRSKLRMEQTTQTTRPTSSEKSVQTEEDHMCAVEPMRGSQRRFNELFDYKLLEDSDETECQLSHAREIKIDEGSVQSETRWHDVIHVLEGEAFNEVCMTQDQEIKKGYKQIEIALDSGAGEHVASRSTAADYPLEESAGSRAGQHFIAAGGARIPNEGQFTLALRSGDLEKKKGRDIKTTFQVAKVTRPLWSVGRICDEGFEVKFTNSEAHVLTKEGKEVCRFRRKGGLYVAELHLKSASQAGFQRRGT